MTTKVKDSIEVRRKIMCARHGHPPVVTTCFGYINCARCGEQIGDMIAGASTAKGKVVMGHETCDECCAAAKGFSAIDLKLLPKDALARVTQLRSTDA